MVNDHIEPEDRPELHIPSINEQVALLGECGRVHLPSGDTCTMQRHHHGSCQFVVLEADPLPAEVTDPPPAG